ncbi:uncharacterized protein LOC127439139 isoform X2 [Myxocyprinus asiaticus]|uniref:uncharacterized protein LOC127439139 isoform X2 n=1 Tax=Myxocyprinus asiaticus TaxID=70543 RepID=UPI002222C092|nr:uncharacterized protein LOC127439139 isoform X2 [Myxocyprinus asiaticus]
MFYQLNSQSMCVRFRNIYRETEQINNKLSINMKKHYLSLLLLLLVEGVFSEVKISVMEEESVTLQIDVTEIQGAETLLWTFNDSKNLIAKIDREKNNEITIPGNDDGRFNNRLQVDKSGSLTITNIRTADSGLYKLEIRSSRGSSYKSFSVTVYSESGVETVSVMEGDSVTLHTDLTEIQRDDEIPWSFFRPEETLIAKVSIENGQRNITVQDDAADGRFRKRVNVDSETGDLTIRDFRRKHSGLYQLQIIRSQTISKIFRVTVSDVSDVETVELKSVSVMEGESVTLNTDLTEILRDELLLWKFKTEGIIIAKINREENQISVYDGTDGKFRGKLELDSRTGSLKIRDIRTEHSGLYELQISSIRGTKHKRFDVNVRDPGLSPGAIAGICVGVIVGVLLLVAATGVIYMICKKKKKEIARKRNRPLWR